MVPRFTLCRDENLVYRTGSLYRDNAQRDRFHPVSQPIGHTPHVRFRPSPVAAPNGASLACGYAPGTV